MSEPDIPLCLLLHGIPGLSAAQLNTLLLRFGSPAKVAAAGWEGWASCGLPSQLCQALELACSNGGHPEARWSVAQGYDAICSAAADVLPITDARYPALLRTIHDPPPLLYCRGNLATLRTPGLAIVGSRRASPAGERLAAELASAATAAGLAVCSGLALGIDGAAHRGAVAGGGPTVAVMATGIDQVYPRRHSKLAARITECGCLLTEFPPGVAPLRGNFPRRNRLISGLSLATVVVEAALPSGSLLTAGTALEQGRDVFAAPWSIFHRNGRGCLRLIRDGAGVVESIEDVLVELGSLYQLQLSLQAEAWPAAGEGPLAPGHARILAFISDHAVDLDRLVAGTGLPVAAVLAGLSSLELQGHIARVSGGYVQAGAE